MLPLLARPLAIAAAILAVLGWVYLRGGQDAALRSQERAHEARESRDATDRGVDRLPDGGAAGELLREWSRKPE